MPVFYAVVKGGNVPPAEDVAAGRGNGATLPHAELPRECDRTRQRGGMYWHKVFLERDVGCGVGKTSAALCEFGSVGMWESELTRRGKVTKLASLGADAKTDRPWSDLTCLAGSRAGMQ